MCKQKRPIRELGEIVLRVRNLKTMQEFYEKIICLALLKRFENMVFFKIAPSYGGHTQTLALFDMSMPPDHPARHFTGMDAQKNFASSSCFRN